MFMDSDKKNFVSSNAQGVRRVLQEHGKYAYLMESTSVEYTIERECELTQIGGLLDSKGYGIALPPSESDFILHLKLRWKRLGILISNLIRLSERFDPRFFTF